MINLEDAKQSGKDFYCVFLYDLLPGQRGTFMTGELWRCYLASDAVEMHVDLRHELQRRWPDGAIRQQVVRGLPLRFFVENTLRADLTRCRGNSTLLHGRLDA